MLKQPAESAITVYVVVSVGLAIGLGQLSQLKPSDGDHEYEDPPAPFKTIDSPAKIVVSLPNSRSDVGMTTKETESSKTLVHDQKPL